MKTTLRTVPKIPGARVSQLIDVHDDLLRRVGQARALFAAITELTHGNRENTEAMILDLSQIGEEICEEGERRTWQAAERSQPPPPDEPA